MLEIALSLLIYESRYRMKRLQQLNPYYEKDGVILWWGDCIEVLRQLEDTSIDSIITDPPYSLSIKKRFSKTSLSDDNKTGKNARDRSTPHARLSKGFMGKEWDNEIAFNVEVWQQCLRVAKPGCILMAMGGSRTSHRLACAIEDAGWEIRDEIKYFYDNTIQFKTFIDSLSEEQLGVYLELHYPSSELAWVYGQGMGLGQNISKKIDEVKGKEREVIGGRNPHLDGGKRKSYTAATGIDYGQYNKIDMVDGMIPVTAPATELAKLFDGRYSRLKPAHENIIVAMKPLDGPYYQNAERWGIAGYNIDENRVGVEQTITTIKDLSQAHGNQFGKSGITYPKIGKKVNPPGRYPANIIHDGSDEVNKEFDKAGVSSGPWGKSKSKSTSQNSTSYVIGKEREIDNSLYQDVGTPARYFQQCPQDEQNEQARFLYTPKSSEKDKGKGSTHPTVKPLALIKYLCRLTKTPTGGVVLDPFVGSGTTLIAAREEGREAIGIEKEKEYCDIAVNRLQGRPNVSPDVVEKEKEEKTEIGNLIDSVLYG